VARSGRHTGVGSGQLTAVRLVPAVRQILVQKGCRRVLDLGCGAGGFLIQLARAEPSLQGLGLDISADAIEEARKNARRFGVETRVEFLQAELGADRLLADNFALKGIEAITAMHLLHEFGRDGTERIVEVLRELKRALPGRLLVFTECYPVDAVAMGKKLPPTFSELDYYLIHPLSRQGVPLPPAEWKAILEKAGLTFLELRDIYWIGLYAAET
jgi:SAM-dependent methyltransferase